MRNQPKWHFKCWRLQTLAPECLAWWGSRCVLPAPCPCLPGPHFSYLLPCAVVGLQLRQDPVSLLQHGADLVPHGRLRLCGLGICEEKEREVWCQMQENRRWGEGPEHRGGVREEASEKGENKRGRTEEKMLWAVPRRHQISPRFRIKKLCSCIFSGLGGRGAHSVTQWGLILWENIFHEGWTSSLESLRTVVHVAGLLRPLWDFGSIRRHTDLSSPSHWFLLPLKVFL